SSNFPASHLDSEPGLIAQSYRPFSSSSLGGPTQVARRKLRPSSATVATSREGRHPPRSATETSQGVGWPPPESDGRRYLKIPLNAFPQASWGTLGPEQK